MGVARGKEPHSARGPGFGPSVLLEFNDGNVLVSDAAFKGVYHMTSPMLKVHCTIFLSGKK